MSCFYPGEPEQAENHSRHATTEHTTVPLVGHAALEGDTGDAGEQDHPAKIDGSVTALQDRTELEQPEHVKEQVHESKVDEDRCYQPPDLSPLEVVVTVSRFATSDVFKFLPFLDYSPLVS